MKARCSDATRSLFVPAGCAKFSLLARRLVWCEGRYKASSPKVWVRSKQSFFYVSNTDRNAKNKPNSAEICAEIHSVFAFLLLPNSVT